MAIIKQDYGEIGGSGYTYPSGTVFNLTTGGGGTTRTMPCEGINTVNLAPSNTSYNYTLDGIDKDGNITNIYTNTKGNKTNVDVSNYKILQFTRVGSSSVSSIYFTITVV